MADEIEKENMIGNMIRNLPIEQMISAPLTATIKAQAEMSMALAQFIKSVGMDENGNIRMVNFNYSDGVEKRHIQAPFIALTGVPNLAIDEVNVSFELSVATAESEKTDQNQTGNSQVDIKSWFSPVTAKMTGSVSHSHNQTRSTDTRAKYSINVNARKQAAPEALLRIIDAITESTAKPVSGASEEDNLIPKVNNGA